MSQLEKTIHHASRSTGSFLIDFMEIILAFLLLSSFIFSLLAKLGRPPAPRTTTTRTEQVFTKKKKKSHWSQKLARKKVRLENIFKKYIEVLFRAADAASKEHPSIFTKQQKASFHKRY